MDRLERWPISAIQQAELVDKLWQSVIGPAAKGIIDTICREYQTPNILAFVLKVKCPDIEVTHTVGDDDLVKSLRFEDCGSAKDNFTYHEYGVVIGYDNLSLRYLGDLFRNLLVDLLTDFHNDHDIQKEEAAA